MKYIAIGRTHWLRDSIDRLQAAGHDLVGIVTAPAVGEYEASEAHFVAQGARYGAPVEVLIGRLTEGHADRFRSSGAQVAISVNWPVLIPDSVRDAFPSGILNAHAGDLPRFRGNAAPNWAILLGESEVVVTIHAMDGGLDAGPVFLKRGIELTDGTYISDIYARMTELIPEMFVSVLDGLTDGSVEPIPQSADPSTSLRAFPRIPDDGAIDWGDPARDIARLVRASSRPFSGAFAWHGADRLTIWRARPRALDFPYVGVPGQVISRDGDGTVVVLTGDGALVLEEASLSGREAGPAANLITSTRVRLTGAGRVRYVRGG